MRRVRTNPPKLTKVQKNSRFLARENADIWKTVTLGENLLSGFREVFCSANLYIG